VLKFYNPGNTRVCEDLTMGIQKGSSHNWCSKRVICCQNKNWREPRARRCYVTAWRIYTMLMIRKRWIICTGVS